MFNPTPTNEVYPFCQGALTFQDTNPSYILNLCFLIIIQYSLQNHSTPSFVLKDSSRPNPTTNLTTEGQFFMSLSHCLSSLGSVIPWTCGLWSSTTTGYLLVDRNSVCSTRVFFTRPVPLPLYLTIILLHTPVSPSVPPRPALSPPSIWVIDPTNG